ncbi:hypothetical protein BJY21_001802 [Kineosphaera limosa]|uniref:Polyketide cyclase/dehydrase n=1 Tax=Kineosphaera limosa NBRC 100340 TaxID=1184609 RepID=K6VMS4_9MICO|nr:SRPBCC family protein [Kineosphaera limosa]NYE00618.1 hypothetical protein [Kineosphaera limosa]GAB97528.1 hypothetical protein KILIM_073_00080 [Kineosphaera limosa NBRC 100340]
MTRPKVEVMEHSIEQVDRGERRVAYCARVHADAHELWAMLANPHRHHEVDGSGTVKPTVIGPRELILGDRFRVDMAMYGIPYSITSTVTDLVPGAVVEWRHPGGHRWRWEFEPVDDGATLVTEIFDYTGSPGPVAAALERLKRPARNADSIRESLANLQRRFGG